MRRSSSFDVRQVSMAHASRVDMFAVALSIEPFAANRFRFLHSFRQPEKFQRERAVIPPSCLRTGGDLTESPRSPGGSRPGIFPVLVSVWLLSSSLNHDLEAKMLKKFMISTA